MKRTALPALIVLLVAPCIATAQVKWTDKQGKTHITQNAPKQDEVAPEEWARLQADMEKAKEAEKADAETLPALAEGAGPIKWKDKNGAEHFGNTPPRRSQVTGAEWERLKGEIAKLNEAKSKPAESPKPVETPKAEEPAGGEKLPDLPPGKTLMWTGKDGKNHMTSTPPSQGQVTTQEWERLKGVIKELQAEAAAAPPATQEKPPAAEEKPPATEGAPAAGEKKEEKKDQTKLEGGPASLGASEVDPASVLAITVSGDVPESGKYKVDGTVMNSSTTMVARNVKLTVDVMSDRKRVDIAAYNPFSFASIYPGASQEFHVTFSIPTTYKRSSLSCEARVLDADIAAVD